MVTNTYQQHKDIASNAYAQGDYLTSLQHFQTSLCLWPEEDTFNRQRILSNIVQCRLMLFDLHKDSLLFRGKNDHDHASHNEDDGKNLVLKEACDLKEALIEAKECIALHTNWAKGHYRLACVYVKLGEESNAAVNRSASSSNSFSNDACNALQSALRIDPRFTEARILLTKLLRQRDGNTSSNNNNNNNNNSFGSSQSNHQQARRGGEDMDDIISLRERFTFFVNDIMERAKLNIINVEAWFYGLDDASRGLLMIGVALLVLYIGFGGRFGLVSRRNNYQSYRGNYKGDNAYNRYSNHNTNQYNYESQSYSDEAFQRSQHRSPYSSRSHSSTSYHLFDESFVSMGIILAVIFVANRFFGISPIQAFWFLQMITGRGGGIYIGRGGFGGGGFRGRMGRRGRWF